MSTKVVELLSRVDELSEAERAEFAVEFDRRRDELVERATDELRAIAQQKGITDEAVVDAVMESRYGSDWKSR